MVEPQKAGQVEPLRKPRPCPQCGKPSARQTYPFCSKRCADIDLGRWLKQDYAIAGEATSSDTSSAGED